MLHQYYRQQRSFLKKKFVHNCKLPTQENVKIEEHYPNSCILTRKILALCLVTTDVSRRKIYSKSHKVLENERLIHLTQYKYIIHPFSDFAYYWELLMIIVFLIQLISTPTFIILQVMSSVYFIFITQILSCFNIIVSCFTGYYRTDIKEVVLNPRSIMLNYLKTGHLIFDLLAGFPAPFICYLCEASTLTQRFLSCFILFNVCPLIRYLEAIRIKRGFSFLIFRLLDAVLIFVIGLCWFTVLIFVGAHLDHASEKMTYNVKIWWWVYNTYAHIDGTKTSEFCFIGYEFFFSTFAIIFGILIRNIILAQLIIMCKTWYSSDRKRAAFFKELNEFCHYKGLPHNLRQRLMQYYKFKLHNVYYNETDIKKQLSENLRSNIKEYICRAWFEADIFILCPLALRQLITIHLDEEIYFKNDIIYEAGDVYENIYFIKSGSILLIFKHKNLMYEISEGNFFSEKALLPNDTLLHECTVIVMEPSQMLKLSRANFFKIIKNFEATYNIILDILETRKKYLHQGIKLKSRLKLGDYYDKIRRYTDSE